MHIRRESQLKLDFSVPGATRTKVTRAIGQFAHGMAPRLASGLLMRIGVPVVAATSPLVLDTVDWDAHGLHGPVATAVTGAGLGGAWGAAVGALIPLTPPDLRLRRVRSAGRGAAVGMLMAPAVAVASEYVANRAKQSLGLQ